MAESAAELLRNARWVALVTQAELAARAGVTRQMVSLYESGKRQPSIDTLERLLGGCGFRLRLALVPEPGILDGPTQAILALPVTARLDARQISALTALASAVPGPPMLVSGLAAARLHGARVTVSELEIWFSDQSDPADIEQFLLAAGAHDPYEPLADTLSLDRLRLRDGALAGLGPVDLQVRTLPHFPQHLELSTPLRLTADGPELRLAAPQTCSLHWHQRDQAYLELQRALRLAAEACDG